MNKNLEDIFVMLGIFMMLGSFLGTIAFWYKLWPEDKDHAIRNEKENKKIWKGIAIDAQDRVKYLENKIREIKENEADFN